MKSESDPCRSPAEDRAQLREELQRAGLTERLQVFDALNREADADEEVPEMPEELRDQLVERFGRRGAQGAAVVPDAPGFFARFVELFRVKPLVAFGGLAAAACAVMFMMLQSGVLDPRQGKISETRGDEKPAAATAGVPVYLFPANEAQPVRAAMAAGRPVVVFDDQADFERRGDMGRAVVVDLGRRVVWGIENGRASVEAAIEGDGLRGVLTEIQAALDKLEKPLDP